jgi:16S rRNA (uracil1498-N3)-methyltransferase
VQLPRFHQPEIVVGLNTLAESEARHALKSLRLRAGAEVELFDGAGHWARGSLETPIGVGEKPHGRRSRTHAAGVRVRAVAFEPPPDCRLSLIVAGCKGPRLDWLIEKCTELGVSRIALADFERSVVRVGATHVEKLRRSATEACKQCGRNWLPEIDAGASLAETIARVEPAALLVAQPGTGSQPIGVCLARQNKSAAAMAAVVGPEGGLTDGELAFFLERGAQRVQLAKHILRVESAAVAIAAVWAAHAVEQGLQEV